MSQDLLTQIYNAFDPFQPLDAEKDQDLYVDFEKARGNAKVERDLGRKIERSQNKPLAQLYAGHRGTGKSTELLRLKKYLEERKCHVVYFAADEGDIDPEDAQYTDILIACTRHLLENLKQADRRIFLPWLEARWQDLIDLALTEIKFDDLKLEIGAKANSSVSELFAKLSTSIRAIPSERQKIREKLNAHTVTLLQTLQAFIADAKKKLPDGKEQLVVIVDNLDRIVPIRRADGRTNHEEIFIDRAEQLRGLGCHVIYTMPIAISIAYSRANDLANLYELEPSILTVIATNTPDGQPYTEGRQRLQDLIVKRVHRHAPDAKLFPDVFESESVLLRLCEMSGGHVRDLLRLVRTAFDAIDELPLTKEAVDRAITGTRDTYRRSVEEEKEWQVLAKVSRDKSLSGEATIYRKLLFSRCILQYAFLGANEHGEVDLQIWYDVHPLVRGVKQFDDAVKSIVMETQQISESNVPLDKIQIYGNNENVYVNIQEIKHPLLSADAELINVMDEAEKLYAQMIDAENYLEASLIARDIHQMYERVADSLKMKQDSDEYAEAIQWSSYWKIRQQTNERRIRSN
ncbi:type II secretory pathway, ATPase PulE/Tfp pilus assembly pathway, ATPase PilB [Pseudanabaena sp. ABRG5-3]|nr:type II secretory pathway, ATPase PulE/Tfp pilus assembly pathway, ATPase PilB [Pseudanabaena sp. ABRG5-3]